MNDWSDFLKKANDLKDELSKAESSLIDKHVTGESGAGLVKVFMNGKMDTEKVQLDDSLMQQPKEVLEELLAGAIRDAVSKVKSISKDQFGHVGNLFDFSGQPK